MTSERKKIVIVGDSNCGKTCLLVRFSQGKYLKDYSILTMFENYKADIYVNEKLVQLDLVDISGIEGNHCLRHLFYPDTDLILMCFDINLPDSLENITSRWQPEVKQFCPRVPVILVGTKKDLRNDDAIRRELDNIKKEPISYIQGTKVASLIKATAYLECSALNDDGVREVFDIAVRTALLGKKNKKTCCLL